ncbi:MAG: hypothetical protein IJW46_08260, partial [Clostridia bacterium]|nr:hypothetical protein [Clostridia bacterium]
MERRTTRKRVMLVSCAVILLCFCVIAGSTYAIFTDSVKSVNHLEAGKLDLTLVRTKLVTRTLDADGYLQTKTDNSSISFTDANAANLFGITESTIIIPFSYIEATMVIGNAGNVAFGYGIYIHSLDEVPNELANQISVTVTHPDGSTTKKWLSELTKDNSLTIVDKKEMGVNDPEITFTVRIEFENLDENGSINN